VTRLRGTTLLSGKHEDDLMASQNIAFYFDPACPWTWNTSRWLVEVAQERGLTIDWRPLSLTVLNAGNDIPEQYLAPMRVGHATLRIVAAAQAAGKTERLGDLYTEVGRRLFYDQEAPTMALVTGAAEVTGLGEFADAATDTSYDDAVTTSTREAIQRGGPDVGSPILVVGERGRGFHGPIVSPPPTGADALRLWDAIAAFSEVPGVYELKHGREGGVAFGPRP
jgi:2-hydroxychromene-2-carboxylate isomerase